MTDFQKEDTLGFYHLLDERHTYKLAHLCFLQTWHSEIHAGADLGSLF